jgi:hypothetical protein
MNRRTHVALVATLMTAAAWGQEVSVYGTTMAQVWKAEVPGFDQKTFTPATQFLGIDATKLGYDGLSFHFYGWGTTDLGYVKASGAKADGELTYGYVDYRFDRANAEIKAGRFAVNQGGGFEQVDGVSARTDLRGGFAISAFGGKSVLYRPDDPAASKDYAYQRDVIFGSRLSWRMKQMGEFGLTFLQDGKTAAKDLDIPSPVDYTRKQVGADIRLTPSTAIMFSGRTILDVASHPDAPAGTEKPSNIAEHDYTLRVKLPGQFSVTGNFVERNFYAYFAGTNLPSLFRQDEKDKFRGYGANVAWGTPGSLQVVGDYRHTHRESFGDANRFGAEARWTPTEKVLTGFGAHRVNASEAVVVDPTVPSYSLSHMELRAWAMYTADRISASVDGILQNFDDKKNPNLNGQTSLYELVGSLGYQVTPALKVSGDLGYGTTALAKNEAKGLLRAEYRFGMARKGGR